MKSALSHLTFWILLGGFALPSLAKGRTGSMVAYNLSHLSFSTKAAEALPDSPYAYERYVESVVGPLLSERTIHVLCQFQF